MRKKRGKRRRPTAEQKAAAAERRKRIRAMVEKIAAMPESERQEILARVGTMPTCAGTALSDNNTILILMQLETASLVGGFRQWRAVGRRVEKGQKALSIWIPIKGKEEEEGDDDEEKKVRFRLGNVFDVSQTVLIEEAS